MTVFRFPNFLPNFFRCDFIGSKHFFAMILAFCPAMIGLFNPQPTLAQRRQSKGTKLVKGDFISWKDILGKKYVGRVVKENNSSVYTEVLSSGNLNRRTVFKSTSKYKIIWKATKKYLFDPKMERTWKSKKGKSKIRAVFNKLDGNKIVLTRKKDGKDIPVVISKLSLSDQSFIKNIREIESGEIIFKRGVPKDVKAILEFEAREPFKTCEIVANQKLSSFVVMKKGDI